MGEWGGASGEERGNGERGGRRGKGAVDDGAEEWAGNGGGEVAAQKEDQQRAV